MATSFPSLSGKTFIRTYYKRSSSKRKFSLISIPFREDLHSDLNIPPPVGINRSRGFPSLSGKTFIRTSNSLLTSTCNSFISIPFREDLHSDSESCTLYRNSAIPHFHPFQGRPSFGHGNVCCECDCVCYRV